MDDMGFSRFCQHPRQIYRLLAARFSVALCPRARLRLISPTPAMSNANFLFRGRYRLFVFRDETRNRWYFQKALVSHTSRNCLVGTSRVDRFFYLSQMPGKDNAFYEIRLSTMEQKCLGPWHYGSVVSSLYLLFFPFLWPNLHRKKL